MNDTTKVQFNTYLRRNHKDYIDTIVQDENSTVESNSDTMAILIAYAKKFWTTDDWNRLADRMKVLGEDGLERICHDDQPRS